MSRSLGLRMPWGLQALLLVFAGGIVGAIARYLIEELIDSPSEGFPWATFTVNIGGALLLGLLLESLAQTPMDEVRRLRLRLLAGTGFTGAFTTYSSLAVEVDLLVHHDRVWLALGYAAASLAVGLAAVLTGIALAGAVRRSLAGDGGVR